MKLEAEKEETMKKNEEIASNYFKFIMFALISL